MRRSIAIVAGTALAAGTVAMASPASADENIAGGGASFPYVFLSQCLTDFNASQKNFNVEYTSTGSGTGKGNFTKEPLFTRRATLKFKGTDPLGWPTFPIGGDHLPHQAEDQEQRPVTGLGYPVEAEHLDEDHGRQDHGLAPPRNPEVQPENRGWHPEAEDHRGLPS